MGGLSGCAVLVGGAGLGGLAGERLRQGLLRKQDRAVPERAEPGRGVGELVGGR